MSQMCKNNYESPFTKISRVELEDGICAASFTGKNVVDGNNKVSIEEQGHGIWDGTGNDIEAGWEEQTRIN